MLRGGMAGQFTKLIGGNPTKVESPRLVPKVAGLSYLRGLD